MEKQILVSESHQKYADKYTRGNHIIGASMWEFEWRSKYRYKMFRKWKYRKLVEACIRKATCEHKIKCIELNVRPDNIQETAAIPMMMSLSKALQLLKGRPAFLFFMYHEKARLRYPKGHLWARGKFVVSLGFVQIEVVNAYVRNRNQHHGTVWIMEE